MKPYPRAGRLDELKATAVNRVLQEAGQLQAEGKKLVSLMRGQPDSPTPATIVEAAIEALRSGRTGYPDNRGEPALRRAVARRLARDHGLFYDPEREILVTDGATGGLCAALAALIQPGDEVLLPDPIYDAYAGPIALWGGRAIPVPAKIVPPAKAGTSTRGRFLFDRHDLEQAWTQRARVLLINTPWNPVGTVFQEDELRQVLEFAVARDLFVLSDEIYETLVYDGKRHVSPASLSPEARERALLINSLSKTYAMTGWRVGYCAGPAPVMSAMLLVWQQWSRGPATFVQDAAVRALDLDANFTKAMTQEYQQRRDRVVSELRDIPGVVPLVPEGGLFVMVDIRGLGRASDEVRRYLLREAGVIVLHGAAYGPGGEGTLRVSFAAGGETLHQGLQRLRRGLLALATEKP